MQQVLCGIAAWTAAMHFDAKRYDATLEYEASGVRREPATIGPAVALTFHFL